MEKKYAAFHMSPVLKVDSKSLIAPLLTYLMLLIFSVIFIVL